MMETIWNEMMQGNFSFAILIVGIIQIICMCLIAKREKDIIKDNKERLDK